MIYRIQTAVKNGSLGKDEVISLDKFFESTFKSLEDQFSREVLQSRPTSNPSISWECAFQCLLHIVFFQDVSYPEPYVTCWTYTITNLGGDKEIQFHKNTANLLLRYITLFFFSLSFF